MPSMNDCLPDKILKSKKARQLTPANKKRAVEMRLVKGMTLQEIGNALGVSKVSIFHQLKKLIPNETAIETYKDHRADILANGQFRLLSALTDAKIKKMAGRDLIVSAGILYDKERIERGQGNSQNSVIFNLIFSSPDLPKGVIEVKTPVNNLSNNAENSYLPNDNK